MHKRASPENKVRLGLLSASQIVKPHVNPSVMCECLMSCCWNLLLVLSHMEPVSLVLISQMMQTGMTNSNNCHSM